MRWKSCAACRPEKNASKHLDKEVDILKNCPSAERLLSILIDLYADQMGVKVEYEIRDEEGGGHGERRAG